MFSNPEIQALLKEGKGEGGQGEGEKKEEEGRVMDSDAERFRLVAHVIGMGFPGLLLLAVVVVL